MTDKTNFAKAFIAAQKAMANAVKDSKNPFFKSAYADLNSIREACLPSLNENGIAVLQPTVQVDGKNYVKTLLLHESGEFMESLTEIIFNKQNDAQAQGSGITYARRYGLQSLVCIGAEDDDGNNASKGKTDKERLAEICKTDVEDLHKKEHDRVFEMVKAELRSCETIEELNQVAIDNKADLAKLKKYAPDLFQELVNQGKDRRAKIEDDLLTSDNVDDIHNE